MFRRIACHVAQSFMGGASKPRWWPACRKFLFRHYWEAYRAVFVRLQTDADHSIRCVGPSDPWQEHPTPCAHAYTINAKATTADASRMHVDHTIDLSRVCQVWAALHADAALHDHQDERAGAWHAGICVHKLGRLLCSFDKVDVAGHAIPGLQFRCGNSRYGVRVPSSSSVSISGTHELRDVDASNVHAGNQMSSCHSLKSARTHTHEATLRLSEDDLRAGPGCSGHLECRTLARI
jgi:hypothetical protein